MKNKNNWLVMALIVSLFSNIYFIYEIKDQKVSARYVINHDIKKYAEFTVHDLNNIQRSITDRKSVDDWHGIYYGLFNELAEVQKQAWLVQEMLLDDAEGISRIVAIQLGALSDWVFENYIESGQILFEEKDKIIDLGNKLKQAGFPTHKVNQRMRNLDLEWYKNTLYKLLKTFEIDLSPYDINS